QTVGADHVVLVADTDVLIALGADGLDPDRIVHTQIFLGDDPGTAQRAVDGRDLIEQDVGIGLVVVDPLLDDGLAILVQGNPAVVDRARPFQQAGLALKRIVAAVAVLIDPFADRVAHEGWFEIPRKAAAVSVDPPYHAEIFDQDVRGLRHDDD